MVIVLAKVGKHVCNLDVCRHLKDDGLRFDKIFTLLSVPDVLGSDVIYIQPGAINHWFSFVRNSRKYLWTRFKPYSCEFEWRFRGSGTFVASCV